MRGVAEVSPLVTVRDVQKLIGTTYPAANKVVARLAEHGILREITGNVRNRVFRYADYIDLFGESIPEAG